MTNSFLKKIARHAGKRAALAGYRLRRSMGLARAGESPVPIIGRQLPPRYQPVMEALWRLGQQRAVTAVAPESILGPMQELARRTGQRGLVCIGYDALKQEPAPAFDAIVLMGEHVQRMPATLAAKVLADWRAIEVSEPLLVLAAPGVGDGLGLDGERAAAAEAALNGLRHVLRELKQLAASGMMMTGAGGAQLRCRYSIFDIEAIREVQHVYFKHVTIAPGDVIVDAGAHLGGFAVPCGMQSSGGAGDAGDATSAGMVIAYEPCPANFELLTANIAANCPGKVRAIPAAVYKERCKLPLQLDPTHSTGHGLFGQRGKGGATLVDCVGLVDVIAEAGGAIDVLKLDAEGAEYDFLFGHADLLRKSVRTIIAEAHIMGKLTGDDLLRFLVDAGYECRREGTLESMIIYAHR